LIAEHTVNSGALHFLQRRFYVFAVNSGAGVFEDVSLIKTKTTYSQMSSEVHGNDGWSKI